MSQSNQQRSLALVCDNGSQHRSADSRKLEGKRMKNLFSRWLLVFAIGVLSGCQTPRVSEVSSNYTPGNEDQVTASILGNARQRGGKITKKEQDLLQVVGPVRFNQLLAEISNAPKSTTIGANTIAGVKQLKEQAQDLNNRLVTLLPGYQSRESELTQAYEISHRACCDRLAGEILNRIKDGNADKAENTWLAVDRDLTQQQRASIVSALSGKYAESLAENTYGAVLLGSTFLANETVKTELPKERYAELTDRLIGAALSQPDGDRKDGLKKLELLETIQKKHGAELPEASKSKIAASISDLQDKFVIRMHPVETFNKSGQSIRDFNTALADKLRATFSSLSPYFTRVEKLPDDLSSQTMGSTPFETLNECLRALKPIPNSNRRLLLLTEVRSVRVEKEPRDRETVRIEWTSSDMTFGEAFRLGLASSGKISHFECDKETQRAQVSASVEVVLYDVPTGKVVFRETVDPDKSFSSVQMSNLMAVGQDTIGGNPVGPLKKVPVNGTPPRHVQRVMSQSTGSLPSNSAMTQEIFRMSASLIGEKLEGFLRSGSN
jgi:hypothetical protein